MKARESKANGGLLTISLFVVAAILLAFSAAGSSRAALTYFSETYGAELSMKDIGVTLLENGVGVSNRDYNNEALGDNWYESTGWLLTGLLEEGKGLELNHTYDEPLAVYNSGNIDEYVRVSIYRYWTTTNPYTTSSEAEVKKLDVSPELIDLHLLCDQTGYSNGWVEDTSSSTKERTVLYYQGVLSTETEGTRTSPLFADKLTIRESDGLTAGMRARVTTTEKDGVITTVYDYDGLYFVLRVDVDAVQTHNSAAAIKSAWGIDMGVHRMNAVD